MFPAADEPSPRRYSLAHLALLIPLVALVIDAWAPIRDNSFLWHIRAGSLQQEAGEVLTSDPFSFTMLGEPWLTQSWLAELLYAWGEDVGGLGFVPPMMLLTSIVAFVGLGLIAFHFSRNVPTTALILLLSTALLLSFLVPRPVIFSFALFALVILGWSKPQLRWTLPLLFWIWASVHGSFVLGLAYVGLSLIMEREWRWMPTAVVSGLATLVTAHGLGVVRILLDFSAARETLELLTEWRKPELFSIVFFPFLIGIGLIIIGSARRSIAPRHLWILVPFLALGLSAMRAVPPAWIALVPLVALGAGELNVGSATRFSSKAAGVFVVALLGVSALMRADAQLDRDRFPLEAVAEVQNLNTFHDDRVGGYLIWAVGPEQLVYLDDRAELYGDRMAEFVGVRRGDIDWQPVFERDGIEQALLRTSDDLVEDLDEAGWSEVHRDEGFVILISST